ncbi:hypothetical protein HCC61_06595 [Streptomyces sp. HNM0575]|uniref:hypothetical protein n=1 Tax=Streptomyces sp. HNM0575 TaxID=2716338 RepID=UPI00145DD66B|nr:hypothetical protein [Streptomyces sp. HNM0575]NLU72351.1 hypothetical protein [Streptomyces sp. HNM0575]
MSVASAVPAAVRLPRTAAARRALLTMLFLGGFLALAVVFGGSANAVSGTDHDGRQSGGAASGLLKSPDSAGSSGISDKAGKAARVGKAGHIGRAAAAAAAKAKAKPGESLTGAELAEQQRRETRRAAERTTSRVTGPFADGADSAGQVTRPVGDAVEDVAGRSGLHELPGRLGLEGLGAVDGRTPGDGGGQAGDEATHGGPCDASDGVAGDRAEGRGAHGVRGAAPAAFPSGSASQATDGDGIAGGGAPADGLPFQQSPAVPALSASQYIGDGQGQRGGPHDPHAVLGGGEHGVPLRYGAVRATDGTPTRELAGDVLEFPG